MTRNKFQDTLKPIAGGNAGGSFGGGGAMTPGTDGQILVTTGGQATWTTPAFPTKVEVATDYVTKTDLSTQLAPLVSGIEHGAAVIDIAAKPTRTAAEGDLYIVGATPTDDFLGQANDIAFFKDGAWTFVSPQKNEAHLNEKDNQIYHWNGNKWNKVGSVADNYPRFVFKDVKSGDASGALFMAAVDVEADHHYIVRGGVLAGYNNQDDRFTLGLREGGNTVGWVYSNTMGSRYKSSALIELMSKPSTASRVIWTLQLEAYSDGVILERYWLTVEDLGI